MGLCATRYTTSPSPIFFSAGQCDAFDNKHIVAEHKSRRRVAIINASLIMRAASFQQQLCSIAGRETAAKFLFLLQFQNEK
jgi:hypothetical protein